MTDKVNEVVKTDNALSSMIAIDNFVKLDSNVQNKILSTFADDKKSLGGWFGKIFGIHPTNIALYFAIGVVTCCFIIIIVDILHSYYKSTEINFVLLKYLLPFMTTALGYAFGKGTK